MKKHSDETPDWEIQRDRIIGLGESSIRKSYYPELQQRILELEKKNRELQAAYAEQTAIGEELRQQFNETAKKERQLRESEERFRNLIEASPVPIVLTRSGFFIYVNSAFCRMAGYENPEDVVGKNILDMIDQEDREKVAGYVTRRERGESVAQHYEAIGIRRDGTRLPFEITLAVIHLSEGPVTMAFINDITQRIRAEEELTKRGERLRRAELIAGLGHWEFDLESGNAQASDGARLIYGLSGQHWSISEVQKIPLSDYRQLLDRALRDLIENNQPYDVEFKILRPADGKIMSIHCIAEYDPKARIVFGVIQDITGQKSVEENLREHENFLTSILENLPDMIFVKDVKDLRFVRFNKAGEKLLGITREELYGKSDYDFFPKNEADYFTKKDREVLAGRHAIDIPEEKIQTRLKGERSLHTTKIPIFDDVGNPRYLLGISEDITEYRQTEEALKLARHKLSLLNAVTFEDIQTAAFSLIAYHELMKMVVTDEKEKTYLDKQVSANQKIIDSLNFAKNYQDMGIQNPRWLDVGQVFLFAISHLDFLHIRHSCHLEGLQIYADPLFEKVLFHLMQNVIRHGVHTTEVTVSFQKKPDELVLIIQDNGIGIPPGEKHMIFDRGYGKHTGLGLFLVREVLSITGMTIKETGEQNKGARFEISVPTGNYRFDQNHKI
jgi:PAS domain S-box-containing protein